MTSLVIKLCHLGALGRRGYTGAKQMVCSRHPPRPLFVLQHFQRWSSFHADFQAFSKRFRQKWVFNLFTKGRLSSLAAHNGISLRKSDEEESVFLGGLTIGRVTCCFLRAGGTSQRNTTAVLCLSLTHIHTPEHLYCR